MSKWTCEVVKDFDGTYYANLCIDGKIVEGLPENINYRSLKTEIKNKTGITLLNCKDIVFEKKGRKQYSLLNGTL